MKADENAIGADFLPAPLKAKTKAMGKAASKQSTIKN